MFQDIPVPSPKPQPRPNNTIIGKTTIDLTRVHETWAVLEQTNQVGLYFDRAPVVFSFNPPSLNKPINIMVCHSATGLEYKSPFQNMIETVYMQEICVQLVQQDEYIVLLGDFNTDEEYNKTIRLWDENLPMMNDEIDEETLFGPTKDMFLQTFTRGIPVNLPTNVFPFLTGSDATPKHNDDIWVPTDDKFYFIKPSAGIRDKRGSCQTGNVSKIPTNVLSEWDTMTRAYFDSVGSIKYKAANKNKLNRMLSMVWSDHRPVYVILQPAVETFQCMHDDAVLNEEVKN